jgi:hypothetical protein
MTDTKIALFDLDDTLLNVKEVMYTSLREEFGPDRVPHWSLWTDFNLELLLGITLDELIEISIRYETFRVVKPHLFSSSILKDLRARGWHLIILTARDGFVPNAYEETKGYLGLNDLVYDELIVTKVGENKMDSLAHHDHITFTIDDQIKNCNSFRDSGKFEHVFLHAQAYNRDCAEYPRLHNLYQAYHHLGLN